jgi:YHS domain-containing protein
MNKNYLFVVVLSIGLFSCNENTKKEPVADKANAMVDSTVTKVDEAFKNVAFDSKRDLTCGMPITAGITDTAHFNNKVYGFCSKECKDEFMKNPATYVAAASK